MPSPDRREVKFSRKQRELGALILKGGNTKAIAGALEIAVNTVYDRVKEMCELVQVADRAQLLLWILQNPGCLYPETKSYAGLHIAPCPCGSHGCLGTIAATLPHAAANYAPSVRDSRAGEADPAPVTR